MGTIAWPYTVDDAYIVARYARNLAHGDGYAFNVGEPSDGVTGPAWVLPGWSAVKLGCDSLVVMKGVGLFCMALAVALVLRRLSQRQRGTAALAFALPLTLVQPEARHLGRCGARDGRRNAAPVRGHAGRDQAPTRRAAYRGCMHRHARLAAARVAFAAGALLVALALRDPREARVALITALPLVATLIAWRVASFGSVLPLSFAAKAGSLEQGAEYTRAGAADLHWHRRPGARCSWSRARPE